jgi:drug/metabolite transporter (DMT)-like permease
MRARLLVLAAAALFSTGGAAIKSTSLTAWQVAGFRSAIAALAILVMLGGARRVPDRATWSVGIVYAATMVLFVLANKLTTAANAIYLQATAPLYILLVAPVLLKEPVKRADVIFMIALALGLGAFFMGQEPATGTAPNPTLGNMAALDVAIIVFLGVFQIGLAYVCLSGGIGGVPALEASLLLLVEPVLNPIWAWLVHGEAPGRWALTGGTIIMIATTLRTLWDVRYAKD